MKILLIISGLHDPGGAERVLTLMANYWAENDHQVIVANFDDGSNPPYYPLSKQVIRVPLDLMRHPAHLPATIKNNLVRLKKLNSFIKTTNPDVVISFLTNTNITTLQASLNLKVPIIVSERNHPAYTSIDPLRKKMRAWLYPRAAAVVCQTKGILDYYGPLLKNNGVIIPNPVLKVKPSPPPEIDLPSGRIILAAGSMSKTKSYQKGFDLLLPIFANLSHKYLDWHLLILGDGSQREVYLKQAQELNLADRIHLPGNVKNIQAIFNISDIFTLSSRFEGFPNVLCEAMASGLPAVSFNCPTGPSDIIRHKVDGLLIPTEDIQAFESALEQLMKDFNQRKQLASRAIEITERFNLEDIMEQWERLIDNILEK